jgi:predicted Zn-dependent peptidase
MNERLSVTEGPLTAPAVRYGWLVPAMPALDRTALAVSLEVLGGGASSRLPRLVAERGLARHAQSWSSSLEGHGLAGVWVELTTRVPVDRARRFVDGAIRALALAGPMPREFARARAKLVLEALLLWENPETRARELARYELDRGGASAWLDEIAALDHVTRNTVRRITGAVFVDPHRSTVEVYPPEWPHDDPALSRQALYTVAKGDTLEGIASRFDVDPSALARSNDLDPKRALPPGQSLVIPPK